MSSVARDRRDSFVSALAVDDGRAAFRETTMKEYARFDHRRRLEWLQSARNKLVASIDQQKASRQVKPPEVDDLLLGGAGDAMAKLRSGAQGASPRACC